MSAATETFTKKAPIYMEHLMRDFDFSELDAAAILGNAGHESGGLVTFQERSPRRGRGGFGWFQWTGSRRNNFEAFSNGAGLDPRSDDANYGFLVKELKGSEKAAVNKTKTARGLEAKVKAFEMAFERAGVKHYDSRIGWAERALAAWNASGAGVPLGKPEAELGTGAGLLKRAREHIGEVYRNIQVPKDNPNWKGPWDCAEFMSWLVYQEGSLLYGCLDDQASPATADAYTGAWKRDVDRLGKRVSVEQAASTVGGIVLRYPPGAGKMGHIALCDGKGGTVEAKGKRYGVVADTVQGRKWDTGVLVPGISYDSGPAIKVNPPEVIYERGAPNLRMDVVAKIQRALAAKGFDPGEIDGDFGPKTQAAVVAFQEAEGLVVDGAVGPDTADALGISLVEKVPLPQDQVPAGSPLQLLLLILTLLSKDRPMAKDLTKTGQGVDPAAVVLTLLVRALLSGRQVDTTELLTSILAGKPLTAPLPQTAPGGTQPPSQSLDEVITALLPVILERLKSLPGTTAAISADGSSKPKAPLTPVNAALGDTIGMALNGRKTGIGILGLLATSILPMFFPELVPVAAVVKGVAAGGGDLIQQVPFHDQATWGGSIVEAAKPVFAALTGWGVLGKLDKWFGGVPQSHR